MSGSSIESASVCRIVQADNKNRFLKSASLEFLILVRAQIANENEIDAIAIYSRF